MTQDELINILKIGLQAASPYNLQPWQFDYKNETLNINYTLGGDGFSNFSDLIYYSLGPLLENLQEGAKHHHFDMQFKILPNPTAHQPHCQVWFYKSTSTEQYPIDHILLRHTNRKPYQNKTIPTHIFPNIQALFKGPQRSVLNVTGQQVFIRGCSLIERLRASNLKLRDEMVSALRFSPEEAQSHRDGLDLRTLEIPIHMSEFLKATRNPFFRKTIGRSFIAQIFADHYNRNLLLKSSLLLAFTEKNHSPESLVQDWKNIQKVLNSLQKEGLATHLLASGVDLTKIPKSFFNTDEQNLLKQAEKLIMHAVGEKAQNILTLLRIGYAPASQFKALRRNPRDLFLK